MAVCGGCIDNYSVSKDFVILTLIWLVSCAYVYILAIPTEPCREVNIIHYNNNIIKFSAEFPMKFFQNNYLLVSNTCSNSKELPSSKFIVVVDSTTIIK